MVSACRNDEYRVFYGLLMSLYLASKSSGALCFDAVGRKCDVLLGLQATKAFVQGRVDRMIGRAAQCHTKRGRCYIYGINHRPCCIHGIALDGEITIGYRLANLMGWCSLIGI
jgi:hypothetical protein